MDMLETFITMLDKVGQFTAQDPNHTEFGFEIKILKTHRRYRIVFIVSELADHHDVLVSSGPSLEGALQDAIGHMEEDLVFYGYRIPDSVKEWVAEQLKKKVENGRVQTV